ncbi:MAG: nucleotide sugar dehydrogenase [Chloroflexi bacterium]|nr:nucleotide sugar dehydrogenase [Chloroflexota bacterium]
MNTSRVCVVGLGYVGLPLAAALATRGHRVVGVDVNPEVLEAVSRGRTTLGEPGLGSLVSQAVECGRLTISPRPEAADVFVLAVPTPIRGLAHKHADLSCVLAAGEGVATVLSPGNLVVLESTCPPGTTAKVLGPVLERGSGLRVGKDFLLAHCPERILPGRTLFELVHNDRVVGGVNSASAEAARALYATFSQGKILVTDATTAELVKVMENTYRDVNIALANEFALVSEHLGVNVWDAIELANHHPRVQFLKPGPGVGGHCIAVDPWFIIGVAPQFTPLIAASRSVNDAMPLHVADLVAQALDGLVGRRVVVLGLTYKADVDDRRESPSAEVIQQLRHAGAEVLIHDAIVAAEAAVEDLATDADCLLLLVDHRAYAQLDPNIIGQRMRRRVAFDTRNFLPRPEWCDSGFELIGLGVGRQQPVLV